MKKQKISTTVKAQEFIATDKAPAAAGPYSQAIKVYIIKFDRLMISSRFVDSSYSSSSSLENNNNNKARFVV